MFPEKSSLDIVKETLCLEKRDDDTPAEVRFHTSYSRLGGGIWIPPSLFEDFVEFLEKVPYTDPSFMFESSVDNEGEVFPFSVSKSAFYRKGLLHVRAGKSSTAFPQGEFQEIVDLLRSMVERVKELSA